MKLVARLTFLYVLTSNDLPFSLVMTNRIDDHTILVMEWFNPLVAVVITMVEVVVMVKDTIIIDHMETIISIK